MKEHLVDVDLELTGIGIIQATNDGEAAVMTGANLNALMKEYIEIKAGGCVYVLQIKNGEITPRKEKEDD